MYITIHIEYTTWRIIRARHVFDITAPRLSAKLKIKMRKTSFLNLARAHKTGCTHAPLHGKCFRHRSYLERLHRLQGLTYKPLLDTSNCIRVDSDKQLTQIVARGPNVRPIQAGFIAKKSETKIEHWQGVVKKKLSNDSARKNQLAFDRQRPSSTARFYALRTLQIEEGLCKTTCVVGNEEAPFFFIDTIRIGDLRNFLEVKEELLLHWRDPNLFEDSLASMFTSLTKTNNIR